MKLTREQMKAILWDYEIEGFEFEQIEKSAWEDQGKFQSCQVIFKQNNKFYSFIAYRSGNYWSGYEMEFWDDEAIEVQKQMFVSSEWKSVSDSNTFYPTSKLNYGYLNQEYIQVSSESGMINICDGVSCGLTFDESLLEVVIQMLIDMKNKRRD